MYCCCWKWLFFFLSITLLHLLFGQSEIGFISSFLKSSMNQVFKSAYFCSRSNSCKIKIFLEEVILSRGGRGLDRFQIFYIRKRTCTYIGSKILTQTLHMVHWVEVGFLMPSGFGNGCTKDEIIPSPMFIMFGSNSVIHQSLIGYYKK